MSIAYLGNRVRWFILSYVELRKTIDKKLIVVSQKRGIIMVMSYFLGALVLLLSYTGSHAFRFPKYYSDGMVMQANNANVWGFIGKILSKKVL